MVFSINFRGAKMPVGTAICIFSFQRNDAILDVVSSLIEL